jgi:8-oxo-dGTP pyrophosphatase MutT (NUDIX family)
MEDDGMAEGPLPSWVHEEGGGHDTTIEENWLFRLRRERFRSRRTGGTHDYYVMHLADAVHVIALTPDDLVVLVRQFRAGSGLDSLEPPGGLLEPGEDPREAGARELLEETGYAGDPAALVGTAWSNPSILTSKIATIVVTNARRIAEPKLDVGEELSVELVPARAIPRLIREGRINHALAVMGLLWWLHAKFPGPLAPPGRVRMTTAQAMRLVGAFGLVCGGLVLALRSRGPGSFLLLVSAFMAAACLALLGRDAVRPGQVVSWFRFKEPPHRRGPSS